MGTVKNLYPPELNTYMDVFNRNLSQISIYFNISRYNKIGDINENAVQVSVRDQFTNKSKLKNLSEIYLTKMYLDNTDTGLYRIDLPASSLKEGEFEANAYYKIQIRFTDKECVPITLPGNPTDPNSAWLNSNLDNFSEWSRVCLIRGITPPELILNKVMQEKTLCEINTQFLSIIGKLDFGPTETEILESYNVVVVDENGDNYFSKTLFADANSPNTIQYDLPIELEDKKQYGLIVQIKTKNSYTQNFIYYLYVNIEEGQEPDIETELIIDKDNGTMNIKVVPNSDSYRKSLVIKRADSRDDFLKWTTVYVLNIDGYPMEDGHYYFHDFAIESGIWYKYQIAETNGYKLGPAIFVNEDPAIVEYDSVFISRNGRQLKVKLNAEISSFKRTVSETKIDTIGSKYPFVVKNGYMNYREFPISGIISFISDESEAPEDIVDSTDQVKISVGREQGFYQGLFLDKREFYKEATDEKPYGIYDDYFNENDIQNRNNYIYERQFREAVIDYLVDGKEKLFRSATEGNMIVRIMNVNLTPNNQLSRLIYTFSAQCYEIDDCTIENLNLYNIQQIPTIEFIDNGGGGIIEKAYETVNLDSYLIGENILDTAVAKLGIGSENQIVQIKEIKHISIDIQDPKPRADGYTIYIDGAPQILSQGHFEMSDLEASTISFDNNYNNIAIELIVEVEIITPSSAAFEPTINPKTDYHVVQTLDNKTYTYNLNYYELLKLGKGEPVVIEDLLIEGPRYSLFSVVTGEGEKIYQIGSTGSIKLVFDEISMLDGQVKGYRYSGKDLDVSLIEDDTYLGDNIIGYYKANVYGQLVKIAKPSDLTVVKAIDTDKTINGLTITASITYYE